MYNRIPFIHEMENAADTYKDELQYLRNLLDKHNIPRSVCIRLIHNHYHLDEGEILAVSELRGDRRRKSESLSSRP